jgi:hypothetical protein
MTPSRVLISAIAIGLASASWLGCSSDPGPTPRVALNSQLGSSTAHPQDVCKQSSAAWIVIGAVGDQATAGSPTVPVNSGDAWNGHTVTATTCSVGADGDGFQVDVAVTLDTVGSFTVHGHFTTTGPIPGVQGIFQRSDTGSFSQNDCNVTFPRPEMTVAPGRVWGQIDCPDASFPAQNRICHASAEFRFENCSGA